MGSYAGDSPYVERMKGVIEFIKTSPEVTGMEKLLTQRCPECNLVPNGNDVAYHQIHDGWIIQGCEGYWVMDPALVGMASGNWSDYRDNLMDPDDWKETGITD